MPHGLELPLISPRHVLEDKVSFSTVCGMLMGNSFTESLVTGNRETVPGIFPWDGKIPRRYNLSAQKPNELHCNGRATTTEKQHIWIAIDMYKKRSHSWVSVVTPEK